MKKIVLGLLMVLSTMSASAALPDVTLKDINGKEVNIANLSRSGKPVIISFFATWCKPCIRELKAIHELYPDWLDETGVRKTVVTKRVVDLFFQNMSENDQPDKE